MQWSNSTYEGPKENGWENGIGKYKFPNGVIYEGNFEKGEFHGDGTLIYPSGVSTNQTTTQHALFTTTLLPERDLVDFTVPYKSSIVL